MDEITECSGNLTLETVQQQFERWRNDPTKGSRIPPRLWEAAAKLCKIYPMTHVCRHLRLSFSDLKKHISPAKSPMSSSTRFMEFDLSCISGGSWQIECDRPGGAKLKMWGNGQQPAIEKVIREFIS